MNTPRGSLPDDTPLLLDAEAVGRLLSVSARAVKTLHRVGQLRGVVVARKLRWRRPDVEAFVRRLSPD
ncbi:MAG: hypothetical protein JW809_16570 [Pirellulales bacterium]|nr:hypothetical protein [Pirellulales bacterium]